MILVAEEGNARLVTSRPTAFQALSVELQNLLDQLRASGE